MPAATALFPSFLGGEISKFAQGRYDRPDYRTSMRVCLNSFPIESGAWTRRPGTAHGGHTRRGNLGRVIKFDFEQSSPITTEWTDGYVRFRNGAVLIGTNDDQAVVSISAANPAVVNVASAVTWATGNTVVFPAAATPLLENRQFLITSIDTTHFSLQDALTGANIDGSTLGALAAGATVRRVQEVVTPYVGQAWKNLRAVQAETTDVLLCPNAAPQVLSVSTLPSAGVSPQFSLAAAVFQDGPYLDPPTNGVQVIPNATSGLVTLQLGFPAYSSATAYAKGAFVSSGGANYVSLVDQNVGNTPASNPTKWQATSAGAAINSGRGFLGTDIGRLVRLFSEPSLWLSGSAYSTGAIVSYNPSGVPGAATYWQAQTSTTGNAPGSDLTHWSLLTSAAALWTWGKITGLSNVINPALAGSTAFGDLVQGGGVNAAFDGVFSKAHTACASFYQGASGSFAPGTVVSMTHYIGRNYSGATPQTISQATIYPSSDLGIGYVNLNYGGGKQAAFPSFTFNLRAKNTPPSGSSDGTLLGTVSGSGTSTQAVNIISNDQVTAWKYVWVEITISGTFANFGTEWEMALNISQESLFNPTTSSSAGCVIEVLGPPLLYSGTTISTWRLGAYSDTTGWPTCGCYDGGRIWLGGAIANRWDASVSNGISGVNINFAPTDQFGVVATSNAISYTFNSDSVNPIFWMSPELQGIVMGTQAGEWLVQAPTAGPISPTNVSARRVTKIGCANVEPRRTEHTTIFVKRYNRKVMEYFADVYSGKYSAPNLADKAQHITSPGMAEIAYTEAVNPILWGRDAAGGLFGVTYKRDSLSSSQGPTFYGWHRHALGSGRVVESICSGPSTGGNLDTLTMVTNDTSTNIRHVELLTDTPDETATLAGSWFLDDAVNPTSISTTAVASDGAPYGGATINGLSYLNGKTVQVFAGGLDCGDRGDNSAYFTDFTVSNGSVFVPFGDGVSAGPGQGLFTQVYLATLSLSQIVVGFTYNSDGQVVRLIAQADTGARNGPAIGDVERTHRLAMKLVNTRGLSMGGNFSTLFPCLFKNTRGDDIGTLDLFTGTFYDQLSDDFTYDDSPCWRVSRPMPATITAIGQNLRTEDM